MLDGRWNFSFTNCICPDARFLSGLNRRAGPWTTSTPYGDQHAQGPVATHSDDLAQWKKKFATMTERPFLAFALAIDFNQEPAQRAMEGAKWKLVATGERGHDRIVAGQHIYARLYMKKFPKTGKLLPPSAAPYANKGLASAYSCSLDVYDFARADLNVPPNTVPSSTYGYKSQLVLSRVPVEKLETFPFPHSNFECIAKTELAHYFLSNAVELFVRAK